MKTKTTKSASKPTSPMNLLRGAVGQRNPIHLQVALEAYKSEGKVSNFGLAYTLAAASPHFASVFPAGKKISNQAGLGIAKPLNVASLSREIQWASVAIFFRRDILNAFVECREQFFDAFVSGNFACAEHLLDKISADCGESSWVLENRLALLTVSGGFEKQKKFVQQLTRERGRSNVSFMATQFGERNEPRVTAAAYQQQFKSRSKSWNVDDDTMAFLTYKLTNKLEPNEAAFASVLAYEGTWSCIDLYESLLDIIRRSKVEAFHNADVCVAALDYLDVKDWRIERLRAYLQDAELGSRDGESAESTALFNLGRYAEAAAAARVEVVRDQRNLSSIATYARASLEVELADGLDGWLPRVVGKALGSLYAGDSGTAQAADDLLKLSMNLRHADFSAEIILPIAELSSRGISERNALVRASHVYRTVSEVAMGVEGPVEGARGGVPWTQAAIDYGAMLAAVGRADWDAALERALRLENEAVIFYKTVGAYFSSHFFERLLRVDEALEKSVSLYVKNKASLPFTPLVQIIRPRGFRELKSMAANPALATAFDIYAQETGRSDKEVALKVAWKKYLSSKNADRPSALLKAGTEMLGQVEIFFLSQVCRQDNMELGGAFSSQVDLDCERMKICIGLAQADRKNLEIYDQEIVELTRRINIEEAVQYLESSRVFVDELGILTWAKKNLESQFLRYIDYLKAGMFSSARELESRLLKIAATSKHRKVALEKYLDDYDVSAESLLEEIVRRLAEAFLSRPRFGLDAFLSSRVRHGSFVGYLRGPLELKRLITKKNSSTGRYFENDYILDRWGISTYKERNSVNSTLAAFSSHVDSLLDETVNKFLHVRSKSKPDGMVSLTAEAGSEGQLFSRWVLLLKSTLDEDSTLDELVSHCIQNLFWPSVKVSLASLQAYIKGELGHELTFAIEKLADDVRPHLHPTKRSSLLEDRFYVKREIKASIDRVAQWFDAPKNNAQLLNMSFSRAIEIGLESTRNARPNFHPNVSWKIDAEADIEINGPAIGIVNDIAFLIFANISKHSGFEEMDLFGNKGPAVEIGIGLVGDEIELTVTSEISSKKDLDEVRRGISSAKAKIYNKEFDSVIQGTQGTGLVRLAIASGLNDGRESEAVQFGLNEASQFFVRILIARGVIEHLREIEMTE